MIEHGTRHNLGVEIDVRPYEGDRRAYLDSIGIGFGEQLDDEAAANFESVLEFGRAIAAYDGNRLVGNAGPSAST